MWATPLPTPMSSWIRALVIASHPFIVLFFLMYLIINFFDRLYKKRGKEFLEYLLTRDWTLRVNGCAPAIAHPIDTLRISSCTIDPVDDFVRSIQLTAQQVRVIIPLTKRWVLGAFPVRSGPGIGIPIREFEKNAFFLFSSYQRMARRRLRGARLLPLLNSRKETHPRKLWVSSGWLPPCTFER